MSKDGNPPAGPNDGRTKRQQRVLPEPDFYTTADVGALLRCREKTVRHRIQDGLIPARREGSRWLILPRDYIEYARKLERQIQDRRFERHVKRALGARSRAASWLR